MSPERTDIPANTTAATAKGRRLPRWLALVSAVAVVAAVSALFVGVRFGSLPVALRYLRGERLILEPTPIRLKNLTIGVPVVKRVEVRNFTAAPVKLTGATYRCTCAVLEGLPAEIPAGATLSLPVRVHATADKKVIDETVIVFTNSRETPQLRVHVIASARE